jgi:hypothetical protein
MIFPMLAIAAAVGLYLLGKKHWPSGEGPFDRLPDGVAQAQPLESNLVYAASGNRYRVTSYKRGETQTYHVAARADASHDWISFLVDLKTGQRADYGANAATPAGLDVMRKDFALS